MAGWKLALNAAVNGTYGPDLANGASGLSGVFSRNRTGAGGAAMVGVSNRSQPSSAHHPCMVRRNCATVASAVAWASAERLLANSASAQFYVALQALPELDGRYAVFGRVSKGMEVIDKIQQGDKITSAKVIAGGILVQGKP